MTKYFSLIGCYNIMVIYFQNYFLFLIKTIIKNQTNYFIYFIKLLLIFSFIILGLLIN